MGVCPDGVSRKLGCVFVVLLIFFVCFCKFLVVNYIKYVRGLSEFHIFEINFTICFFMSKKQLTFVPKFLVRTNYINLI